MAKANSFLREQLNTLLAKETEMTSRSADLQSNLDNHNAELKEVKAAIKALTPLVPEVKEEASTETK